MNGKINQYIHTMEYYLAVKRNEVLIHAKTQMNLKDIMLCEGSQSKKINIVRTHLREIPRQILEKK